MKISERFFALIACALAIVGARATGYKVEGAVADSAGVAEPFATLYIYELPDTLNAKVSALAAEDGSFSEALAKAGDYRLAVTSVGKEPLRRDFTLTPSRPVADLGTLVMKSSASVLREVVATATKPLVSREIDRIAYDVQNDPESKTNPLDEILKKVPMVTVDPDGTVKIKGGTDFQIYKNGRKNQAFTNNSKEIFKSIPASMIKKIEVITDPGAREDAEGVSQILNIVTMESTVIKGVMGTAGLSWLSSTNAPSPSLWLMSQIDKVTFSVNGSFIARPSRSGHQIHSTERTFDDSDNSSRERTEQTVSTKSGDIGFELSYEIDTLNLITADFNAFVFRQTQRAHFQYEMLDPADELIYSYRSRRITSPVTLHWLGGNINYQRLTRRKGEKLIFTYMISGNGRSLTETNKYSDQVNMPVEYTGVNTRTHTKFLEHTFQADWTRPLWQGHTFDVGAKYVYRDNRSKGDVEYVGQRSVHTDFTHLTQIGALFADYRVNLARWGFRAGVRYEFSRLEAKDHENADKNYHSTLNDVVPNAAVSYNINDRNSMRLSYSSSIQRPGITYLDPTVISNPQSTSQGNPDLGSARNNSFNFNYGFFSSKVSLDFNAGYRFSDNSIIQVQTAKDDHIYSTYENAGKNSTFSSSLYLQWQAFKKTMLILNGGASYSRYENPSMHIKAGGWDANAYAQVRQTLPWKLSLSVYASYFSGSTSLYSVFKAVGAAKVNHGVNLQRSFLKEGRLSVRFNVFNPFGGRYSKYRSHMINVPYVSNSYSLTDNFRGVSLYVSYRFGKLNAQVKKVRGVSNNDVVGGTQR